MAAIPSMVQNVDSTVYVVLDDFGALGTAYRETDAEDCDRTAVIRDLLQGQIHDPVRVVAFNTAENWSADVEEYLGRLRRNEAVAQHDILYFGEVRRAARIDHVGQFFEVGRPY
jgi:hypothetical protein